VGESMLFVYLDLGFVLVCQNVCARGERERGVGVGGIEL
jgi:hypothetical protein